MSETAEKVAPTNAEEANTPSATDVDSLQAITEVTEIPIEKCSLHPAAVLFPAMPRKQFEELMEDIKRNGLREPVFANKELQVFDGRHRLQACRALGWKSIEAWIMNWSEEKITGVSISANLHRRHLDKTQRALIAARLKVGVTRETESIARLATQMNVSKRSIDRALVVVRKGSHQLQQDVDAGRITLAAAVEIADLPLGEQELLLKDTKDNIRLRVAQITKAPKPIDNEDNLTWREIQMRYYDKMEFIEKLCGDLPIPSLLHLVHRLSERSDRIKVLPPAGASDTQRIGQDAANPEESTEATRCAPMDAASLSDALAATTLR